MIGTENGANSRKYYDQHVAAKFKADSEVTSLQGQTRIGESAFDAVYDNRFRLILQGVELYFSQVKKNAPFFSIIIPVYNVAPYLRECLDSVLAQTFADWEAICVDDGSTDGSGAILDEYAAKDKRFRVIHQPNAGVSAARNAALEVVRGEWFLFLDGDDVLRVDGLELFVLYLKGGNYDGLLVQPYIPCWEGDVIRPREITTKVLVENATKEDLIFGPYAANGFPFSRIYKTDIYKHLRFPVGVRMCEDIYFWFDALCIPTKWVILNAEYYLYRQRGDSVCGQKNPNDSEATLDAALYACDRIENEIGYGKEGCRRYFDRWPWSSANGLDTFIGQYKKVSKATRHAICSKAMAIRDKIGAWPYTRGIKCKLWLVENNMGFMICIVNMGECICSSSQRIMRLFHYIRKNGLVFAVGKIKRQILHQGEYARRTHK